MKTVTIHDAKTNLSKYIAAAKKGEKIYIGSFGKPEVVLSLPKASEIKPKKRVLGLGKANMYVAEGAFSEEADKEITDLLLGGDELEYHAK